ncbi:DUF2125 domain-containing protein [Azospirillum sp. RWY-5-1]|uniref:DUF2125 domain-containing protein n=1 Tax=Azospirillum oleiclasticum TaxID=2735135 RepID=A0ABX2TB05_9PROT|nr:DUF2125 domain-containing protein [Azospirillum oleiclasticum]NYZ15357.1 DUF2125 domain-containing protein [Azospirillum oleiclasticum]NYZ21222.1 DUF2125 domain-containing protein [Azospirillum oleiclasticum]
MKHRKTITILAGLAAFALAGYTVWWWIAAHAVERGIADWMEQQRRQGALVAYGALDMGGWPFALHATVTEPAYEGHGVAWSGSRLTAEAKPWDFSVIDLAFDGTHRLSLSADEATKVTLKAAGGTGRVTMGPDGQPRSLALDVTDLAVMPAAGEPMTVARLDLAGARPALPPASHQDTGLTVTLAAGGLRLPGPAPDGLGPQVQRVDASLRVQGRPPMPERPAIAAWSRDGGVVEVDRLGIDWGPLSMAVNGTVALDARLQPLAAMTAEIQGAEQALTAVQERLRPNQLAAARSILAMLSRPPEGGGPPVIKAPLSVQDGWLYVGPLKVAPVPRLPW